MNEIKPEEFNQNIIDLLAKRWMLVTAKKNDAVNTMTASWGGLGYLWNRKVAYVFIRSTRYTKEFADAAETISLSVLGEAWREQLGYLGKVSGRTEDKIKQAGLHIVYYNDTPCFEEAELTIVGRKLFAQQLEADGFIDKTFFESKYPDQNDLHTMYVLDIEKIYSKE